MIVYFDDIVLLLLYYVRKIIILLLFLYIINYTYDTLDIFSVVFYYPKTKQNQTCTIKRVQLWNTGKEQA